MEQYEVNINLNIKKQNGLFVCTVEVPEMKEALQMRHKDYEPLLFNMLRFALDSELFKEKTPLLRTMIEELQGA